MGSRAASAIAPRKRPTQERAQATVEAILRACAHILGAEGYDAVTTNAVAARAGVSIGSLYQYFPSKEAMVAELSDRHCDRMNALFAGVFLNARHLPPDRLARELVAAIYRAKREDPALARALREQLPKVGRLGRFEQSIADITDVVAAYFEEHRALLRVDCPRRAAMYAVEVGEHLTMVSIRKCPDLDPEVAIDEITDVIVRYVLA